MTLTDFFGKDEKDVTFILHMETIMTIYTNTKSEGPLVCMIGVTASASFVG